MDYAGSILELVGNTPLVRLTRVTRELGPVDRQPLILAKLETLNPGGSVKDRIGLPMIEAAERAGLLRPGGTIIEPTSGNTGHGLAIAAALKGYRCIFVMADKQSAEKQQLLRAYGAEVVLCPTNVAPESPESYYSVAARLARDIPGAFKPDQYWNEENPKAHEATTGPELWRQTEGRIGHLVASVGTGGTISGVARYLKRQNPAIVVIGADPEGSVLSGDTARPYLTEGDRRGLPPGDLRPGGRRSLGPGLGPRRVRGGPPDHARGGHPRRRVVRHGARGRPRRGAPDHDRGPATARRSGRRRHPAGRRPVLPLQALQRRMDAGERAHGPTRRGQPGRRAARRCAITDRPCRTSSWRGRPNASARRSPRSRTFGISQMPVSEAPDGDELAAIVGSISREGPARPGVPRPARSSSAPSARSWTGRSRSSTPTHSSTRRSRQLTGGAPALLAVRGGRPVGIVTKLDLLEYLAHRPTSAG